GSYGDDTQHAIDGATDLSNHSPDTDVLVLAIRRYPEMCANTSFVTGRGANHPSFKLQPIAEALSPAKTATPPACHAITGADITRVVFREWEGGLLEGLCANCINLKDRHINCERAQVVPLQEKQAQSDRLPPTQATLHQAMMHAHFQLIVLPSPGDYGWVMENNEWVPVTTTIAPAPEATIQFYFTTCKAGGVQRSDARRIDVSAAKLGFSLHRSV
ncbi:hypothetical protein QZH41_019452, partial [Actinostola sp. cb2023]